MPIYVRGELMLKLKPLIAAKAKENLVTHTKNGYKQLCQNSDNPVDTKKELSKLAGVSHDTISRIEKIAAKAKENQGQRTDLTSGRILPNVFRESVYLFLKACNLGVITYSVMISPYKL